MASEGNILGNSSIFTFQQGLTHSAVIVKMFVVTAKTTGVNDCGNDDFAPPQKRAIGPFINWCCSPRNIFSMLTLKPECHIRR